MQVKFLRSSVITHPDLMVTSKTGVFDKPATIAAMQAVGARVHRGDITPAEFQNLTRLRVQEGHILEHRQAAWLVRLGVAEPYDQECIDACLQFDSQLPAIQAAQQRINRAQMTGQRSHDATDEQADILAAH